MKTPQKIRVAIAGMGNVAKSLVEGVAYYQENDNTVGIMDEDIGGYQVSDIQFVVGFDIDKRKVGKSMPDALNALPNCAMVHSTNVDKVCEAGATVYKGPVFDGYPKHFDDFPDEVVFRVDKAQSAISTKEYDAILTERKVDVLLNFMPVGSEEASKWYIENAIKAGVHVVNCMPSYISTTAAKQLESLAIKHRVTVIGSDMRSAFGASRMSEVLQGALLDSGFLVTQHIQTNMAAGATQGTEHVMNGVTANTDFLNMADKDRLVSKHISKENVLNGQNKVRDKSIAGTTMFAGPSLTVQQKPGGTYRGSDNKIANFDIVAFGWGGARIEMSARLSVQDSPNSAPVVAAAIRYCRVASEMGIVGILRGPSARTQKTPPLQLSTADALYECKQLANRQYTKLTAMQLGDVDVDDLAYTFQDDKTDYQS